MNEAAISASLLAIAVLVSKYSATVEIKSIIETDSVSELVRIWRKKIDNQEIVI